MSPRRRGLWGHAGFLRLWAGQTVSLLGTAVTMLALPTAAILLLHASPFDVGLLAAVQRIPFPLLALFAGAWVDRVRRRPLMVAADAGRALAVASIPVAAMQGALTLPQLYAVAVLLGTFSVLFDVGSLAYLPALVDADQLGEANTRLQLSYAASGLVGPPLAGVLIQLMGAARCLLVDAASYVVSIVSLLLIRTPESRPSRAEERGGMRHEIAEGLRHVAGEPVLRALLATEAAACAGLYLALPVVIVFVYEDLHLSPAVFGAVSAVEGAGQVAGALLAARMVRRLHLGPALALTQAATAISIAALPLALATPAIPVVAVLSLLLGVAAVAHDVTQLTLRQSITPAHLQGRVNATFRAVFWGVWPLASLLGGLLASAWGHAQTLMLGGALALVSSAAVLRTALWSLRAYPAPSRPAAEPAARA